MQPQSPVGICCFWKGENDYASGVWSFCPVSKWLLTTPHQFFIMLLYHKGSEINWSGIIRSRFITGQNDPKSSLLKSWPSRSMMHLCGCQLLSRDTSIICGIFRNSTHFGDLYLLAHEELEARTACVWKPLPWSLRETENKTKIICHKKVTTRWAA